MRLRRRFRASVLGIVLALPLVTYATVESPIIFAKTSRAPAVDPCKLLTDTEVRKGFPEAKAGKVDHSLEEHGIISCLWDHPGGRFAVQVYEGEQGTIDNEIRGMSLMFLDPLKAGAGQNVRYEIIKDVGDQARAIVETADEKKGFLTDSAILVAQRKGLQLILMSTQLAQRERISALKVLEDLGRAAAKRL
ncbi:MAG: hypothetical protein H0X01_10490 [Nitrospira sp.]|nr:hypothetical protein [Nitrospira sp.]